MADIYIPNPREQRVLESIKRLGREMGIRTSGRKVDGRIARRLISIGYAIQIGGLVYVTDEGARALKRCPT